MTDADRVFALDRRLLRRALQRAAPHYDQAAVVQREIGSRLLDRLDLLHFKPSVILDLGCGTGAITALLLKKYRRAHIMGLELAPALVAATQQRASWWQVVRGVVAEPEALPLATASCDLIFSNLALQWCFDLERVIAELKRVLKPGGALLFSTLGPDTLIELRRSWHVADPEHNHVNAFFEMHDIGDALSRAGLGEPVVDVERLTLTYPTLDKLMADLKALGATNVTAGRPLGLSGKTRWQAMRTRYEQLRRSDGLLPVTCEIIYGHAWGVLPKHAEDHKAGSTVFFPLTRLERHPPSRP